MLTAKVDAENNLVSVQCSGDLSNLIADSTYVIRVIYDSMKNHPEAREIYKTMVQEMIQDGGNVWRDENAES